MKSLVKSVPKFFSVALAVIFIFTAIFSNSFFVFNSDVGAADCSVFPDEVSCTPSGCSWSPGTSCSGFDESSCFNPCTSNYSSCSWNGSSCDGGGSCSSYGDEGSCNGGTYFTSCSGFYGTASCVGTYDAEVPVLSTATVSDSTIILTYNENLDTNSVPVKGDFSVSVNGSPVSLLEASSVVISGTTITLTLQNPVVSGYLVEISYTVPGSNPIQDLVGNDAGALSNQAVSNTTAPPVLSTATVNRVTLTLTYDKVLDSNSTPATSTFAVTSNGSPVNVSSVSVPGNYTVVLTLQSSVAIGATVVVSYTAPGSNPIQDMVGSDAGNLSSQAVTNNTAAPAISTAVGSNTTITLTYNYTLDASSTPATSAFSVTSNGSPITVSSVSVPGNTTVVLTTSTTIGVGTTVLVNYTAPGSNPIQDIYGNDAENLSSQAVTNNSSAPTRVTSKVNRNTVVLTYDRSLDASSTPATSAFTVNVGGSPVTISEVIISGDSRIILTLASTVGAETTVTASYTTPGSNPARDIYGNNISNFNNASVTNNTSLSCSLITVGGRPDSSVIVGDKLYVNNSSTANVSVIDMNTNSVVRTISVGNSPFTSTVVGKKIYVANYASNSVSVIDTTTDTVVATISVGSLPYAGNAVGDKVYFSNFNSGTVSVVNTITDTVIKTITVGSHPFKMSLVGNSLYINNQGSNTVSVINTASDTVTATLSVGTNPFGSTVAGDKLYISNSSGNTVSVINTNDNSVSSISLGKTSVAAYYVGTNLYVINRTAGTVTVIDTLTDTVSATITVGVTPDSATIVGTKLYVNNAGSDTVSVIDTSDDSVTTITGVGDTPYLSYLYGNKLYINNNANTSSGNSVSVINTSNNTVLNVCAPQLTSITSSTSNGSYSTGQSINITANFSEDIGTSSKMRITLNTGAIVNLTTISGTTLGGVYVVGAGEAIPDLSVSSISTNSIYTNIFDTSTTTNTDFNYFKPVSPELTGNTYRNIGDLKDLVVGGPYCGISVGTEPYQLATVDDIVYVANQGSNNVSVIDTGADNAIISTIAVQGEPYGLSYNSTSKEVYVANLASSSVSVIDADPLSGSYNTVTHTIAVGTQPYYVTSLGANMYVTNNVSKYVSVISTATHAVTATTTVGVAPRGIKAHGTDLYVANFGSNSYAGESSQGTVSVIDSTNNTVSETINVGSGPRGVAVNGDEVYVANWNDGTVSVISTASNTVTHTITVGNGPRGILSLGSNIYVENYNDGTISVISTASHTVTATVSVGNTPAGMTAVGTDIYISRFTDDLVSVFDTTDNTMRSSCATHDTITPTISSVVATSTTSTSAVITWTTSEVATSTINFGLTASYGTASSSAVSTTTQSIILSSLTASTLYHYMISSWDAFGNLATTTDATFTTIAEVAATSSATSTDDSQVVASVSGPSAGGGGFVSANGITNIVTTNNNNSVNANTNKPAISTGTGLPANYKFTRTTSVGARNIEVLNLQKFLNSQGYKVSATGAGAPGKETTYFGPATRAALARFQKLNGITPAVGFFGPITRAFINNLIKGGR